ncbi:MAG: PEP-CTERM sorting domain-containing protein [Planctomycetota bacterium]
MPPTIRCCLVLLMLAAPAWGVAIDGDLDDWDPSLRVSSADDPRPAEIYMTADSEWLYLAMAFDQDLTDRRSGAGTIDMLSVNFGLSGDSFDACRFNLRQSNDAARWAYAPLVDGYYSSWSIAQDLDGSGELDDADYSPFWGADYASVPWPEDIRTRTDFAPHRVTEWAVPLSLLSAEPGETVYAQIFTYTDGPDGLQQTWNWPDHNASDFAGYGDKTGGLSVEVPASSPVPEPATAILLGLTGSVLLALRPRQRPD